MSKNRNRKYKFFTVLLMVVILLLAGLLGYCAVEILTMGKIPTQTNASGGIETKEVNKQVESTSESEDGVQRLSDADLDEMLFLGDSRTVGLEDCGLIEKKNTFAEIGISHVTFMKREFTDTVTNTTGTFGTIVAARQPKCIYVALGVNGVAFMGPDDFLTSIGELIDILKTNAPQAQIVIQSILPVSGQASFDNENLNNETIEEMNVYLAELADEKSVLYFDPSAVIEDDAGQLNEEYNSGDGLHYNDAGYEKIFDYICAHLKEITD